MAVGPRGGRRRESHGSFGRERGGSARARREVGRCARDDGDCDGKTNEEEAGEER